MRKMINRMIAFASSRYQCECDWCGNVEECKKRWIYSEVDPTGTIRMLCDDCVSMCVKG